MVAERSISWLLAMFLAFLGTFVVAYGGYKSGEKAGIVQGLTNMHNMCYNSGGFIIINRKVVLCSPGGLLSEEEQKALDKKPEM